MAYEFYSSTTWHFFRSDDGTDGDHSGFVGRETPGNTRLNRTARGSFTTPNVPIGKLSFYNNGNSYPYVWTGCSGTIQLCWAISEDPEAYIHANGTTHGYHGLIEIKATGDNRYIKSAAVTDVSLKPNTTYYIFIYPNSTVGYDGYILYKTMTMIFTGEVNNTVWICTGGNNWQRAIPWVCTGGTNWQQAIPWVCTGGTNWKQCGG